MPTNPQPRHRCPRCEQTVERGELVVFDAGELFHLRCFAESGGVLDLVGEFLRRQTSTPFCHTCLSLALQIPYDEARKAITVLRDAPDFSVSVGGPCSACRQTRVTARHTGAEGPR